MKMLLTNYRVAYLFYLFQIKFFLSECENQHAELVTQWEQVQTFHTGYVEPSDDKLADLTNIPSIKLKQAIISKLNEVKCGFLFSAHFHLIMAKGIYMEKEKSNLNGTTYFSVSFLQETVNMVRSLYNVEQIIMDEIWLVYNYFSEIDTCLNSYRRNESRNIYMRKYDFVVAKLEKYLEMNCDENNLFNINSKLCNHYQEHTYSLSKSNQSHNVAIMLIKINKILLNNLHKENLEKGLRNFVDQKIDFSFLKNAIDEKPHDMFKRNFQEFCLTYIGNDDWIRLKTIAEGNLNISQDNIGLMQLLFYGRLSNMIISIFKMSMLRIIWQYLINLNDIILQYDSKTVCENKTVIGHVQELNFLLTGFITMLNLNDDIFHELNTVARSGIAGYIENKNEIIKKLADEHNSISTELNQSSSISQMSRIGNLKHVIKKADELHKDVQYIIERNYDFKLFQSYLKFIDGITRFIKQAIESKSPTQTIIKIIF